MNILTNKKLKHVYLRKNKLFIIIIIISKLSQLKLAILRIFRGKFNEKGIKKVGKLLQDKHVERRQVISQN